MTDALPRTAQAAERPCELREIHVPVPVITQGHHRHPQYLQLRVYHEVKDLELLWLCGTDHDSVHAWLYWLLGERSRPDVDPGRLVKAEAERTYAWWLSVNKA